MFFANAIGVWEAGNYLHLPWADDRQHQRTDHARVVFLHLCIASSSCILRSCYVRVHIGRAGAASARKKMLPFVLLGRQVPLYSTLFWTMWSWCSMHCMWFLNAVFLYYVPYEHGYTYIYICIWMTHWEVYVFGIASTLSPLLWGWIYWMLLDWFLIRSTTLRST